MPVQCTPTHHVVDVEPAVAGRSICSVTSAGEPNRKRSRTSSSNARSKSSLRGHHLVLAPGAIGLVFRFQRRLRAGASPRRASRATNTSRSIGNSARERLAAGVELALVDVHLPRQGLDLVVRVDEPAIRHARGAPDADIGIGADPHRRHRFLHRLDRAVRAVELEMRALHRHEILGPQALAPRPGIPRSAGRPAAASCRTP